MAKNLIPGAPITLGNRDFIVPALSFGQLKGLKKELELTDNPQEMTEQVFEGLITIVTAAIGRNYPEIKREEVENLIDFNNVKQLMAAIKGESGFITNKPPESGSDATGE